MKFALNGALTIGTWDGANIEIANEVGKENIYIFGLRVSDIEKLKIKGYNPSSYYEKNVRIKEVIDLITCGFFSEGNPGLFQLIIDDLLYQDQYMHLADFQDYYNCQNRISEDFLDKEKWTKKSIINVANMGFFSSDRTIKEYAEQIWDVKPVHIEI